MMQKKGRIIKGIGGFYYVESSGSIYESKASRLFEYKNIRPTVGDYVEININDDESAYITKIFDRKNLLLRPPVSNVDQILIIASVESPKINKWLIDRMILLSRLNGLDPHIVVNKYDLNEKEALDIQKSYQSSGFDTHVSSLEDQESISNLKSILNHESTVLMGPSGAGKSSLINEIAQMNLETGKVSEKTSRGKHTTRHVEIYPYSGDSYLIDTPGFSSLSLDFISDTSHLESLYKEFDEFKPCKFNNCLHIKEPKCSVKQAIQDDKLENFRYENYLDFHEEIKQRRIY